MPCWRRQTKTERRAAAPGASRPQSPASGGLLFGDHQHEVQTRRRVALRRLDFRSTGGTGACAAENRQDRRDLSAERQRRQRRRPCQGGDRNRGRDHQQRASRPRQSAGDQGSRSARPRRGKSRGGVRRQPGQPRDRTEPGAAADHRGEGGCAQRLLSVRHYADHQRDRRKIRHSLFERRVGGGQPDRARLQMVLPHHAGRVRLSRKSISTFSRT